MAIFVKHVPCPKCGSRDNRAVYSDGGEWCFGCGGSTASSISGFVRELQAEEEDIPTWTLPDDLSTNFPESVIKYANKYSISIPELITFNYAYSRRTSALWRILERDCPEKPHGPLWSNSRSAEARYGLSVPRKSGLPKTKFFGSKEVYPIAGTKRNGSLVLTEDSFSSIVTSRVQDAMPLFGTTLSMTKLVKLSKVYQHITVWLDHDKFKEGWDIATRFKWLGLTTNVVLTKHDPKCYSIEEIKGYLNV